MNRKRRPPKTGQMDWSIASALFQTPVVDSLSNQSSPVLASPLANRGQRAVESDNRSTAAACADSSRRVGRNAAGHRNDKRLGCHAAAVEVFGSKTWSSSCSSCGEAEIAA